MSDEPQLTTHGESIDQSFLLMVESHVINGVKLSRDGLVLEAPATANADALFADAPYTVALSLERLREHRRLRRSRELAASRRNRR